MKQQINLFQPMFRPQRKPFAAVTMLVLTGFFLLVFTAFYFYGMQQLNDIEFQISRIDIELGKSRNQVEQLIRQFPEKSENKLLELEFARLSSELEKRLAISAALEEHSLENKRPFSALLESLARKHIDGTWLTRISIGDGGQTLGFEGKTYSSELVPVYIQQLSEEASFGGLAFNVLELRRAEKDALDLDFLVRTTPEKL